ncbi:MAG TPA: AI-2E family transporter, partial [Spirochaetales bacterium]|nr:AI-2E family transporter [Spirochaetales bacterium]
MGEDRYKGFSFSKASFFLLAFMYVLLAGAALKLTTPVVLPFVIAVLLTFVLEPLITLLERMHIPRILAVLLAVSGIAAAIVVVGYILVNSILTITMLYPKYEQRFTEIYTLMANFFDLPYDEHLSLVQNLWGSLGLKDRLRQFALSIGQSSLGFLTDSTMVVLFVVFLLLELSHFRERLNVAFAGKMSERIQKIGSAVITQVARYLSVKFFISLATGILVGVFLSILGMDFPIVWAVLSFILNFIPNIGSIAAGGGVTLFALVQFWPSPGPIIAAVAVTRSPGGSSPHC